MQNISRLPEGVFLAKTSLFGAQNLRHVTRPCPFKSAAKENVVHVLAEIEDYWKAELARKSRLGQASDCTRRDFQEIVKQFYA
jgi:hypothetical protein